MDPVCFVIWSDLLFRVLPCVNHGGNDWSVEINARARRNEVNTHGPACEV